MLESTYQAKLIKKIERLLPGCLVLKNDSGYRQGIPDLLVLYLDRWAVIEVKISLNEPHQPNQDYYIDLANEMSFGAFICPENEEEVLRALQQSFQSHRETRVS